MNFSYEFERSSFIDDSDEVEIIMDGVHITEDEEKKAIHKAIQGYAPDVIYYDDFKFAVPSTIRFLESGQSAHDMALLNSDSNQHWQNIFTDILKGHAPQNAATFQEDVVDWLQNENNDPGVVHGRLRNMGQYLDKILQEWVNNKHNSIDGFQIIRKYGMEEDKVFQDYQICVLSGDNEFKMNERSKGLQWSFCFHILTSIRKNRHKAGFIFLLDEPASNLHIRPQKQNAKASTEFVLRELCCCI